MAASNEWVVWFNGSIVPEREARVPFRDRGFKYGDAVFDMTRTFGHRIFRIREHVERLYRSLRYVRIDPGLSPAEMIRLSEEVLERNLHLIGQEDDYWVGQRITRGVDAAPGETPAETGPTVVIETTPLPFKARAAYYRDGIEVVVPTVRRVPPGSLSPRAKSHNYLNMIIGEHEAKAVNPKAWAVLLDVNGNLAEGIGSNIFIVRDGVLLTPRERYVLPGVSRQTALDLAKKLGIPSEEADLDFYDAVTADEAFITSSSWCICPASSINGRRIGGGTVPGPVTKRLMDAYVELVGCDWVGQYLKYANE